MKRIIAVCLVLVFVCAGAAPLNAQLIREGKSRKSQPADEVSRFASVRAYSNGSGVLVEWEMAFEKRNLGFLVNRIDQGTSTVVSPDMIVSAGPTQGSGQRYSFFDADGTSSSAYFVQNLSMDGRIGMSSTAPVEPVPELGDLMRQGSATKTNSRLVDQKLVLPSLLASEVASNQMVADDATHAWVVAQPGVRISVRREGFYRVTKAELLAGGFNVNGDPSLWQLYRQGVEQAIIVGPNGDYIEFYGNGVDTRETDTAVYFLVSGPSAGKRIETRVARTFAGTVSSRNYSQVFEFRQRSIYLSQILNGSDVDNFWGSPISTAADTTLNFTLTGVDFNVPEVALEVKFQGISFSPHNILVTLNGNSIPAATGSQQAAFFKQYSIPTSHLREGANTIVFRGSGASQVSLFDTMTIGFPRKHLAAQNQLKFYTANYRLSKLEGFSSQNVRVFDTTFDGTPILWSNLGVVQEGATWSVRMPADRGRAMFAVEDSALKQVLAVTPIEPAVLRAPTNAATYVVITHANWKAEAQTWAAYRANQGYSVKVVDVSDIYDEFNYGDLSSLSIRSFLQYAETNWQTDPDYVLLLGDATYDSRNYEGTGYHNYVPTHMVDTVFMETGSDDFLADFNGDGLAEMAVGRIAARNGQTITNVLAKVTAFESAAPTLQSRGALFAYDCFDANNNYNFQQYSTALKNLLPGTVPSSMVGRCQTTTPPATPSSELISSLNTGKLVVNYSGHGTTGVWANDTFFGNLSVPQLNNAANPSIFTMLTCLNGYFMNSTNRSLAENLLESTTGGAVAAWASTGETTPTEQNQMAARFFQRLSSGSLERMGDLANDAKSVISGGSDVRLSWALLGDPLLKVRTASTGDRPVKQR